MTVPFVRYFWLCCKVPAVARDALARGRARAHAASSLSPTNGTASVSVHGPRPKARSTRRASPTMSRVRLKIAAWLCGAHASPQIKALDRRVGRLHRFETAHRPNQLLQLAVVGLDDVVQILDLPVLCVLWALAFGLQPGESGGIGRRLVGVDDLRLFPILQPSESLGKKTLRRHRVPRRGEIEIDRVAQLVDGSVEIRPLAAGLHVSLVDPPAPRARPAPVPAQPLLDFGRVLLHPSVDGRVIDRHAAFCHHLLEIAIAYAVAAIPAHRPQHDLAPKWRPLEI